MSGSSEQVSQEAGQEVRLSGLEAGLPLSEAVFRSLCEAIRTGVYQPGDRLREEEVAQRLQVSRTPVRDAFGRLLTKRLVEPGGGRGLTIRRLNMPEVLELYTMREILEGAAARLAAQHISPAEIDSLHEIEEALEANARSPDEMARLNRRLHDTVIGAARNRYLDHALQELQDAIALLGRTTFSVEGRPTTAAQEHRDMVAAITSRDPARAEAAARAHIQGALKARLRLIQR